MMLMRVDLKVGQSVKIGDAMITLERKSGQVARLAVNAAATIPILRPPLAEDTTCCAYQKKHILPLD